MLHSALDLAWSAPYAAGGLDPALPSLVSEIIDSKKNARVFCAYDAAVDIAMFLAAKGIMVALDLQSPELAALCSFLAVAADLPLQVRQGDPFALAQEDMRTDHKPSHDVAIVNPPFNVRFPAIAEDGLGTTLPAPMNSEASGVTLALARGRDAAVCLLPPSFLFQASKANQAFKARAVYDYGLDAVVSLPMGSLHGTPLSSALVIFRPSATKRRAHLLPNVFMVDARGYRPRSGSDLTLPEGFGALIREHTPSEISSLVSISEIEANDFVLLPERYVLSPEMRRVRELTSSSKTVVLDDIVELYRPQALRGPKDTGLAHDTLFEVGVADIDEVGLVRDASKQVFVTPEAALQARKARLEPGDIILVIKGSVGKVGFIREVPEGSNWLASQSFAILRLRGHGPIRDPRVLFRYLSSSLGQGVLQSLRVGTAVPGLQMADARRLAVAVPPLEEQGEIARDVDELFAIQDEIEQLRSKLVDRQKAIWPEDRGTKPQPQ